jgi:hypothetical protein
MLQNGPGFSFFLLCFIIVIIQAQKYAIASIHENRNIMDNELVDVVNCSRILNQINDQEILDPNQNHMYARWTTTNPPFFISMNNWEYDPMRKGKDL